TAPTWVTEDRAPEKYSAKRRPAKSRAPSACRKSSTLQGEPISARIRGTEIPSPWWLRFPAFAAPVAAGLQKADRCPCSASAVSSAGRASASQSLGTKLSAEPRTRRKAARTLSALNFPVCVPSIRTCRLDGTFSAVCYAAYRGSGVCLAVDAEGVVRVGHIHPGGPAVDR